MGPTRSPTRSKSALVSCSSDSAGESPKFNHAIPTEFGHESDHIEELRSAVFTGDRVLAVRSDRDVHYAEYGSSRRVQVRVNEATASSTQTERASVTGICAAPETRIGVGCENERRGVSLRDEPSSAHLDRSHGQQGQVKNYRAASGADEPVAERQAIRFPVQLDGCGRGSENIATDRFSSLGASSIEGNGTGQALRVFSRGKWKGYKWAQTGRVLDEKSGKENETAPLVGSSSQQSRRTPAALSAGNRSLPNQCNVGNATAPATGRGPRLTQYDDHNLAVSDMSDFEKVKTVAPLRTAASVAENSKKSNHGSKGQALLAREQNGSCPMSDLSVATGDGRARREEDSVQKNTAQWSTGISDLHCSAAFTPDESAHVGSLQRQIPTPGSTAYRTSSLHPVISDCSVPALGSCSSDVNPLSAFAAGKVEFCRSQASAACLTSTRISVLNSATTASGPDSEILAFPSLECTSDSVSVQIEDGPSPEEGRARPGLAPAMGRANTSSTAGPAPAPRSGKDRGNRPGGSSSSTEPRSTRASESGVGAWASTLRSGLMGGSESSATTSQPRRVPPDDIIGAPVRAVTSSWDLNPSDRTDDCFLDVNGWGAGRRDDRPPRDASDEGDARTAVSTAGGLPNYSTFASSIMGVSMQQTRVTAGPISSAHSSRIPGSIGSGTSSLKGAAAAARPGESALSDSSSPGFRFGTEVEPPDAALLRAAPDPLVAPVRREAQSSAAPLALTASTTRPAWTRTSGSQAPLYNNRHPSALDLQDLQQTGSSNVAFCDASGDNRLINFTRSGSTASTLSVPNANASDAAVATAAATNSDAVKSEMSPTRPKRSMRVQIASGSSPEPATGDVGPTAITGRQNTRPSPGLAGVAGKKRTVLDESRDTSASAAADAGSGSALIAGASIFSATSQWIRSNFSTVAATSPAWPSVGTQIRDGTAHGFHHVNSDSNDKSKGREQLRGPVPSTDSNWDHYIDLGSERTRNDTGFEGRTKLPRSNANSPLSQSARRLNQTERIRQRNHQSTGIHYPSSSGPSSSSLEAIFLGLELVLQFLGLIWSGVYDLTWCLAGECGFERKPNRGHWIRIQRDRLNPSQRDHNQYHNLCCFSALYTWCRCTACCGRADTASAVTCGRRRISDSPCSHATSRAQRPKTSLATSSSDQEDDATVPLAGRTQRRGLQICNIRSLCWCQVALLMALLLTVSGILGAGLIAWGTLSMPPIIGENWAPKLPTSEAKAGVPAAGSSSQSADYSSPVGQNVKPSSIAKTLATDKNPDEFELCDCEIDKTQITALILADALAAVAGPVLGSPESDSDAQALVIASSGSPHTSSTSHGSQRSRGPKRKATAITTTETAPTVPTPHLVRPQADASSASRKRSDLMHAPPNVGSLLKLKKRCPCSGGEKKEPASSGSGSLLQKSKVAAVQGPHTQSLTPHDEIQKEPVRSDSGSLLQKSKVAAVQAPHTQPLTKVGAWASTLVSAFGGWISGLIGRPHDEIETEKKDPVVSDSDSPSEGPVSQALEQGVTDQHRRLPDDDPPEIDEFLRNLNAHEAKTATNDPVGSNLDSPSGGSGSQALEQGVTDQQRRLPDEDLPEIDKFLRNLNAHEVKTAKTDPVGSNSDSPSGGSGSQALEQGVTDQQRRPPDEDLPEIDEFLRNLNARAAEFEGIPANANGLLADFDRNPVGHFPSLGSPRTAPHLHEPVRPTQAKGQEQETNDEVERIRQRAEKVLQDVQASTAKIEDSLANGGTVFRAPELQQMQAKGQGQLTDDEHVELEMQKLLQNVQASAAKIEHQASGGVGDPPMQMVKSGRNKAALVTAHQAKQKQQGHHSSSGTHPVAPHYDLRKPVRPKKDRGKRSEATYQDKLAAFKAQIAIHKKKAEQRNTRPSGVKLPKKGVEMNIEETIKSVLKNSPLDTNAFKLKSTEENNPAVVSAKQRLLRMMCEIYGNEKDKDSCKQNKLGSARLASASTLPPFPTEEDRDHHFEITIPPLMKDILSYVQAATTHTPRYNQVLTTIILCEKALAPYFPVSRTKTVTSVDEQPRTIALAQVPTGQGKTVTAAMMGILLQMYFRSHVSTQRQIHHLYVGIFAPNPLLASQDYNAVKNIYEEAQLTARLDLKSGPTDSSSFQIVHTTPYTTVSDLLDVSREVEKAKLTGRQAFANSFQWNNPDHNIGRITNGPASGEQRKTSFIAFVDEADRIKFDHIVEGVQYMKRVPRSHQISEVLAFLGTLGVLVGRCKGSNLEEIREILRTALPAMWEEDKRSAWDPEKDNRLVKFKATISGLDTTTKKCLKSIGTGIRSKAKKLLAGDLPYLGCDEYEYYTGEDEAPDCNLYRGMVSGNWEHWWDEAHNLLGEDPRLRNGKQYITNGRGLCHENELTDPPNENFRNLRELLLCDNGRSGLETVSQTEKFYFKVVPATLRGAFQAVMEWKNRIDESARTSIGDTALRNMRTRVSNALSSIEMEWKSLQENGRGYPENWEFPSKILEGCALTPIIHVADGGSGVPQPDVHFSYATEFLLEFRENDGRTIHQMQVSEYFKSRMEGFARFSGIIGFTGTLPLPEHRALPEQSSVSSSSSVPLPYPFFINVMQNMPVDKVNQFNLPKMNGPLNDVSVAVVPPFVESRLVTYPQASVSTTHYELYLEKAKQTESESNLQEYLAFVAATEVVHGKISGKSYMAEHCILVVLPDSGTSRIFEYMLDDLISGRPDGLPALHKYEISGTADVDRPALETTHKPGHVIRGTPVAGRGVDLACIATRGLLVIKVLYSDSAREDLQVQGRAARKGDPGAFLQISLEGYESTLAEKRGEMTLQTARSLNNVIVKDVTSSIACSLMENWAHALSKFKRLETAKQLADQALLFLSSQTNHDSLENSVKEMLSGEEEAKKGISLNGFLNEFLAKAWKFNSDEHDQVVKKLIGEIKSEVIPQKLPLLEYVNSCSSESEQ